MTKRLVLMVGLLMSLLMASTSLVAAQAAPNVTKIGKAVEATDIPALIDGLAAPIAIRDLPADFTDATTVDITSSKDVNAATCVYDASTLTLEGAAAYELEVDPEAGPFIRACASINYLVYTKKALGLDPLGDFKSGLLGSLDTEPGTPDANGGVATLEDMTVAGADAVLFTYTIENGSRAASVQILTVIVGNVIVLTQIQTQGDTVIDAETLAPVSTSLVEAAITHLGEVADEAA